jgi:hypothetical protein
MQSLTINHPQLLNTVRLMIEISKLIYAFLIQKYSAKITVKHIKIFIRHGCVHFSLEVLRLRAFVRLATNFLPSPKKHYSYV